MAQLTHEFLLKEVAGALYAHRRLLDQSTKIESECSTLDKLNSEKRSSSGRSGVPSSSGKHGSPASPRKGSAPNSGAVKSGLSPKANKVSPPRRKVDGLPGKLNFSPKDKEKQDTMESFDARLQSIVTSALMGDGSALADTKDSKIAEDIKQYALNLGLPGGFKFPPYGVDHSQQRKPIPGAIPPPIDHKNDLVIKREKESPKGTGSISQISLPVKIPLKDVGRKPATLPVSIPLSSVNCQGKPGQGSLHGRDPGHHQGGARITSPPALRDAYSPISRPSSSSSTASAESVKGLPHGATRRSTSPRTPHSLAAMNSFNIDSIVSEARRSAAATGGRFIPPLPHAHKDSYTGQLSPGAHHSKAAGGAPPHPVGYSMYPPQLPASMLGIMPLSPAEKDSYAHLNPGAKQLLMNSGPPYMLPPTSQHSQAFYGYHGTVNGLPKDSPLMMDKQAKRGKRKRSNSSSGSGGSKLGPSETKKLGVKGTPSVPPPPPHHQPDIVSMMSNASQPLPIQAIADAESSNKSSPVVRQGQGHRIDLHSTYLYLKTKQKIKFYSFGILIFFA